MTSTDGPTPAPGEDAAAATARADALQRKLDAVQALLAEERAARGPVRTESDEVRDLREELARVRAQLAAAEKETRKLRASGTYQAGLKVKQAAGPALRARATARTTARRAVKAARRRLPR